VFEPVDPALAALSAHVAEDTARALLDLMERRQLQVDEALIAPGWPGDVLYFVLDGSLDVELEQPGGTVRVGHIGPGTWVGEMAFLDGGEPTATVLCTGNSWLLALRRGTFDRLCADRPAVAADLTRALCCCLAQRIQDSSSGVLEAVGDDAFELTHPVAEEGPFARLLARLTGARHG
jgi:CRP-like cAMP-binding protein